MKVLLVDLQAETREEKQEALSTAGYEVLTKDTYNLHEVDAEVRCAVIGCQTISAPVLSLCARLVNRGIPVILVAMSQMPMVHRNQLSQSGKFTFKLWSPNTMKLTNLVGETIANAQSK